MTRKEIAACVVVAALVLLFLVLYGTILGMAVCVPVHP